MIGCCIAGCDKPHEARGWCNTHYARWRRTGSAERLPFTPEPCSVEGCESPSRCHGMCHMHDMRVQRTGTAVPRQRPTLRERFEAKVDFTDSCWLWTGTVGPNGYGQIGSPARRDRMVYAHRTAYEIYVGPIPDGLQIDHLCRVRHCVNPAHLEPVTPAENLRRAREARRAS